ncbi:putative arginine N-methyltransferase, type II [Trypanosoma rangeli]|uniref:Putative arginine N-methyltransferase, type II n=1 Tax=Trypanosoma rangeli TaxID=5698 RepID=A0A3R7KRX3_TRYRA|nr:putative arginine N-methyltransferase, type II [Trypanosoma rangeli]RNF08484.1 putative arginine N-methyltransferase, type II [Trypanosoma rangeli]|eukprot:RNF08484.1 putative arginine N-methyltransferase, type II [Trypanosoma rangeli]
MANAADSATSTADESKRGSLFGVSATCPMPSEENFSQRSSLHHFGIIARKSVLCASRQQKACGASLCAFPLDDATACESGAWRATGCSPLAALACGVEDLEGGVEQTWSLLSQSSLWGSSVCGCITASSWGVPANVKNSISSFLRLGAFLSLRAVLVPLPDCGDDGSETTAAFTEAVAVLAEHLRQARTTNIWVYCDAASQAHRVAFCRLRTALVWGSTTPPLLTEAVKSVSREALQRVMPYLYFSETFGALPSEWLGEPVVAFNVPRVDSVERALRFGAFRAAPDSDLPSDILPRIHSYWATAQPPFISLMAFVVELLRRRAAPMFSVDEFGRAYTLLDQLYERHILDDGKDNFVNFEDTLQLPLQPLGHMLSSGVYEVFEMDAAKYRQYHAAMLHYFRDWLENYEERSHGKMCSQHVKSTTGEGMKTVYVVLLGAGRGPLIGECLFAASSVGVRVHLFAVEKNPEAVDFVRLRLRADPQWCYGIDTYGHVVETLCADGRAVTATIVGSLPTQWGLCDLVVSELLGSFGDNELSPECLEEFYEDFRRHQASVGIPLNPHMTSIPQEYTAWIAPLYSGWMEEALAGTAVSGLTVLPSWCHDRCAAIFHSMFVTNVCRGVALSSPQPCWTFNHFTGKEYFQQEREALLTFRMNTSGRCSGFIGYFTAVLFATKSNCDGETKKDVFVSTTLSTAPEERTFGMFSWFPCFFATAPRDMLEVDANDCLQLHLRRCVDAAGRRVFYTYDASLLSKGPVGAVKATTTVINDGGWAASILLYS